MVPGPSAEPEGPAIHERSRRIEGAVVLGAYTAAYIQDCEQWVRNQIADPTAI